MRDRLGLWTARESCGVKFAQPGGNNESGFASFIARHSEVRAAFLRLWGMRTISSICAPPDLRELLANASYNEHFAGRMNVVRGKGEIVLRTLKNAPGR